MYVTSTKGQPLERRFKERLRQPRSWSSSNSISRRQSRICRLGQSFAWPRRRTKWRNYNEYCLTSHGASIAEEYIWTIIAGSEIKETRNQCCLNQLLKCLFTGQLADCYASKLSTQTTKAVTLSPPKPVVPNLSLMEPKRLCKFQGFGVGPMHGSFCTLRKCKPMFGRNLILFLQSRTVRWMHRWNLGVQYLQQGYELLA